MLANSSFEGGTTHDTHSGVVYDNIFVPEKWVAWWNETSPYGRIEMQVIEAKAPYLDPPRIYEGSQALKFFTMWRIHEAGLYQTVDVIPGTIYNVAAFAHAWSSQDDNPQTSEGAPGAFFALEGTAGLSDDQKNFTFAIGIDLTGGTDPWASSVIWGTGAHIYNAYAQIPTLGFVATGTRATVFLRSTVLWPFKHNDAYMDAATLTIAEEPPDPDCYGLPREQYTRRYNVYPTWATPERRNEIADHCADIQETCGPSYDDAGLGALDDKTAVLWDIPADQRPLYLDFFDVYYPGTAVEFAGDSPEPPTPTGLYIPYGTKLGIHTMNPGGTPEYVAACAVAGAPVPVFKAVQDWGYLKLVKEASPQTITIARYVMPFDGAGEIQYATQAQIEQRAADYMGTYYALLEEQGQYDDGHRLEYIDYLELLNEADPPGVQGYHNLSLLMIAMLDIGETWDLPVKHFACFGMNAGTPEWDEIVAATNTGLLERIANGGHILTLHEGAIPFSNPIDAGWPGTIPGAPYVERAGALCGRYRYWLHLAQERGLYLPIAISEFVSGPDYDTAHTGEIMARMVWYDELIGDDPEALAFLPFTCGGTGMGWPNQDYSPFLPDFQQYAIATKDRTNAAPDGEPEPPELEIEILDVRDQMAVNLDSPWYPWLQRTLDEISTVFVHHSAGAASSSLSTVIAISNYHTSPTGKNRPGICYTYVIGADGTIWYVSDIENVVFSQGSVDYPGDENRYGVGVCLLGCFINGAEPTSAQLNSLTLLISYLESLIGRTLSVWGHKDVAVTQCPGDSWPFKSGWGRTETEADTLLGFNDHPGATGTASDWLMAQ